MAPFIGSGPEVYAYTAETIQQKLATIQLTAPVAPAVKTTNYIREPLQLAGAIEAWKNFHVTPSSAAISQRGVVFFRRQDDLDNELQKELVQRLGQLVGKPPTSGLHIHPFMKASQVTPENKDDVVSVISSEMNKKLYANKEPNPYADAEAKRQDGRNLWHSDITFEQIPSDYAVLRMTQLPKTGGDTLFGSGYELYDRISAPYQKFLEGLTATYAQSEASKAQFKIYSGERGAPEHVGEELSAEHPVVRTNKSPAGSPSTLSDPTARKSTA